MFRHIIVEEFPFFYTSNVKLGLVGSCVIVLHHMCTVYGAGQRVNLCAQVVAKNA